MKPFFAPLTRRLKERLAASLCRENKENVRIRARLLRMESLETRDLLSVTPTEYAAIRDQFSQFNLPEDSATVRVAEVSNADVNALNASIQKALSESNANLIVVRGFDGATFDGTITVDFSQAKANSETPSISIVAASNGETFVAIDAVATVVADDSGVFNGKSVVPYIDSYLGPDNGKSGEAYRPTTAESKTLINVDALLKDDDFSFAKGTGYATVIIDTGINATHNYFKDAQGNSRIVYQYDFSNDDADASDFIGHGTNVAGIAAGTTGVATEADIIALKVFPDVDGGAYDSDILDALNWVVANAKTYNIASVNMSLGSGNVDYYLENGDYYTVYKQLEDLGVVVCVSAGNDFYQYESVQGINRLAAFDSVVAVGAVSDMTYRGTITWSSGAQAYSLAPDAIVPFSQRSTTLTTTMAPGFLLASAGIGADDAVSQMGGTSQASPTVAGVAVLAQQIANKYLDRSLTVDEFQTLLDETGTLIYDGTVDDGAIENDNVVNTESWYKRIDAYALAKAIKAMAVQFDVGDAPETAEKVVFDENGVYQFGDALGNGEHGLSDVDFYQVELTAGNVYEFTTSQPAAGLRVDTHLRLFDGAIAEVARADDGGDGVYAKLIFEATTSGTYYLGVSSYATRDFTPTTPGSGSQGAVGDYVLTVSEKSVPFAPSGLTVGGYDATARTVSISWTDNSNSETGFRVEYTNGGDWTSATVEANTTSYVLTNVSPGSRYSLRVYSFNAAGDSATYASNLFVAQTLPFEPSDVEIDRYDFTTKTLTLSWLDNSKNERGFRVEVSTDAGATWSVAQTVGANVASANCENIEINVAYRFRVCAFNEIGDSAWAYGEFQTGTKPSAPSDVRFDNFDATAKTVQLHWNDNSDDETGFRVEISYDKGANWRLVQTTSADSTSGTYYAQPGVAYSYRVCAVNDAGYSDWAYGEFGPTTAPSAPSDVRFENFDATAKNVRMLWNDNSDDETGFRVEISYDNGTNWYLVQTTSVDSTSRTCYAQSGSFYSYRVCAVNDAGKSDWAYGNFGPSETPSAPSGVQFVNYDSTAKSVQMTWNDNSDNETSFRVEISYNKGTNWYLAQTMKVDSTSRTCYAQSGVAYSYRVCAVNAAGKSDWVYGEFGPSAVPNAPSDLQFANCDSTAKTVQIAWNDRSDNESSFRVEVSYNKGADWRLVRTTSANATSVVCGAQAGVDYSYRVCAVNAVGNSDWVYGEFGSTKAPNAPSDVRFDHYDATANTVQMTWNDNSDDELAFRVEISYDNGANWRLDETTTANATAKTCSAQSGVSYSYRVCAVNAAGNSDWVYAEFGPSAAPNAPSDVRFDHYDATANTVQMTWNDNSDNETNFRVEISYNNGGNWYLAQTTKADATSKTCYAQSGVSYSYRVCAVNAAGNSDWAYGEFGPSAAPNAPNAVRFENYDATANTVLMTWNDNSDNETNFRVEISYNNGASWRLVQTTLANATSRTCVVSPDRSYAFRVCAVNAAGNSDWAYGTFDAPKTPATAPLADNKIDFFAQLAQDDDFWFVFDEI